MGIFVAVLITLVSAIGISSKEGLFKKGTDTTYRDTVAFEKRAMEERLASEKSKQRTVVAMENDDSDMNQARAKSVVREKKLEKGIAKLERLEEKMGWND